MANRLNFGWDCLGLLTYLAILLNLFKSIYRVIIDVLAAVDTRTKALGLIKSTLFKRVLNANIQRILFRLVQHYNLAFVVAPLLLAYAFQLSILAGLDRGAVNILDVHDIEDLLICLYLNIGTRRRFDAYRSFDIQLISKTVLAGLLHDSKQLITLIITFN